MKIKTLYNIKNDLQRHHRSKEELELYYVKLRLEKSFQTYNEEAVKTINYLKGIDNIKVLKSLNRS